MVRDAGRTLGEVLAGTVNFFNPTVIVIGGDIAEAHAQLLAGVREGIFSRSLPLATRDLRIVPCRLGDRAGVIGAAIMVIEHVLWPMPSTARSNPPPEGVDLAEPDPQVEAGASGSSTKNVEPIPSPDSTQIFPPIRRTSSRQM